jgi:hypothetical protein
MRVRSFLVLSLVVLAWSAAPPALAAEPGTLTIGVHVPYFQASEADR